MIITHSLLQYSQYILFYLFYFFYEKVREIIITLSFHNILNTDPYLFYYFYENVGERRERESGGREGEGETGGGREKREGWERDKRKREIEIERDE